jgi:hypothetical protein
MPQDVSGTAIDRARSRHRWGEARSPLPLAPSQTPASAFGCAGMNRNVPHCRGTLDSRYADFKSSRVKPIDGEEARAHLHEKMQQRVE